jgi:hypothetical protein
MAKTPNTKHQAPEKHQAPNTKANHRGGFGAWSLELLCFLELGVWSFSGVWCLVFGVSST